LGWNRIPATVVDLDQIVRGEFAENAQRKNFLPSEIDAIRRTLEATEKAAARQRMSDGAKGKGSESFATLPGKVSDKIGTYAQISGRTVEKIAAVVDAAKREPETFGPLVEQMDQSGRVDRVYKQMQIINRQREHAARTKQGCTVADLEALIVSGQRFAVVYADPPWEWTTFGPAGRIRSCADHHFGLAEIEEIKALGSVVARLAADDAVLFLWGTWPKLPEALDVITSWGFVYKTLGFVWIKQIRSGDKPRTGMGYWTRSNSEYCLLATKGAPSRIAKDVHEVVTTPAGEHSAKPEEARQRIERLVEGPYLELYARREVEGWT
jgi:N6-adenosine-specific RNA methylase IME4